jgi:hypothetical protein
MRDPTSNAPIGVQRIALRESNSRVEKIDRRMLGRAGVVKLWAAGRTLVVGEGLETVLAAATRIPFEGAALAPAWACLSASKLAALPPIPGVERLVVLADHDDEGKRAAAQITDQWRAAGRAVVPLLPPEEGTDFNDLILRENNNAIA